ncbi:MAG: hypothetical protein KAT40_07615 [Bacteroidales bacterium]|nr:hypothetical protein [Bacteroidales bacterium]
MKDLKNWLFYCLILFFLVPRTVFSQQHERIQELEAQKIGFFTKKLQLTTKEAQGFWPVYNDYQARKNKIIQDRRNTIRYYIQNLNNLSEKEIEDMTGKFIRLTKEESDLFLAYHEKFKEVLPIKKVMQIYIAEEEYKTFLLRQLRNRRINQNQRKF